MPDAQPQLSRRQALIGAGTLAGGGLTALAYSPDETTAAASGLSISDTSRTLGPNESLDSVDLSTTLSYEYDSSHTLSSVEFELYISKPNDSLTKLASTTLTDPPKADSGSISLGGSITGTDAFDVSDFDASKGATTVQDINIKAVLKLFVNEEREGVADAEDTVSVEVVREAMSVAGRVWGEGDVRVVTSSG